MSYVRKLKYEIKPNGAYRVVRNCAGCKAKSIYTCTNHFRINSNGSKMDVWLIYQCEKCKHTYNLSIYERIRVSDIAKNEYEKFLSNDLALAIRYGNDKSIFSSNKAVIDVSLSNYSIVEMPILAKDDTGLGDEESMIEISNPYRITMRPEKVLSEILRVSRSKVKSYILHQDIEIDEDSLTGVTKVKVCKRLTLS